nr:hypothetical protein [Nitrosomonas nitrosa]
MTTNRARKRVSFIYTRIQLFLLCGTTFWLLAACSAFPKRHTDTIATIEVATRIHYGMQRLGASSARSECYAKRISGSLIESEGIEAANLIEKSLSKDEMRENVIGASDPVRQAFIKAHFGCSLSG